MSINALINCVTQLFKAMVETAKKRGNPNLKPVWTTLDTKVIRIPVYLADTMMSLARQVDGGKIKQSKLNQLCLNPEEISQELTAITGKPALAIVPDPEPKPIELLIEQFEAEQAASWGQSPNQRGEFKTTSRSWDKYHEFKEWLAKN